MVVSAVARSFPGPASDPAESPPSRGRWSRHRPNERDSVIASGCSPNFQYSITAPEWMASPHGFLPVSANCAPVSEAYL